MSAKMELFFPLSSEIMTTVRLATGGVCSLAGLDLDESEDCKVCVTESLLLLMHRGYKTARVRMEEDGGLLFSIAGEGERQETAKSAEDDISLALLGALLGDVEEEKRDGELCALKFRFAKQA